MMAAPTYVSGTKRIANGVHTNTSANESADFAESESRGQTPKKGTLIPCGGRMNPVADSIDSSIKKSTVSNTLFPRVP